MYEETKLDLVFRDMRLRPEAAYRHIFDAPDRDLRGRIITHNFAYVIDGNSTSPPKIKGEDDAVEAVWEDLSWVRKNPTQFYADHFKMLNVMAQKVGLIEPRLPVVVMQEVAVG